MRRFELLLMLILFVCFGAYSQEVIVNPDGTHSISTGSVIVNSDGTHSVRTGSVIVNSNGTHSTVHGNVIVNSNGTHSIIAGNTVVSPDGKHSTLTPSSFFDSKKTVETDEERYPWGIFSLIFPPKKKVVGSGKEVNKVENQSVEPTNESPLK